MARLRINSPDWRVDARQVAASRITRLTAFLSDRWKWAVAVVLGLLVIAAVIAGYSVWSGRKETEAVTLLQRAASRLEAKTRDGTDDAERGEGLRLLHEVIQRYPTAAAAAEATLRLGTHYVAGGKYGEARAAYTTYLQKNPRGRIAFAAALGVGDTYLAERNYEKAVETYSRLVEQFSQEPLLPEAQLHLATALLGLNREKEASVLLETVVVTSRNTGWAQRAQSELYRSGLSAR